MNKKSMLIYMIYSFAILILILLLILFFINLEKDNVNNNILINNNNTDNKLPTNNSSIIEQPSNEISQVENEFLNVTDYFDIKNNTIYFTIEGIANNFFESINNIGVNNEKVYSLLGSEYINKNNITKQKIGDIFSKYSGNKFIVKSIKEKIIENNICIFIVYGTIKEETYNMAIVTDETNLNYCIYPYDYLKTNNIDNLNIKSIKRNEYNKLEYKDVSNELASQYRFENYKHYALNNIDELYKKIDSEYSKKRFGSLEKFREYINGNKKRIETSTLQSYKVTRDGEVVRYSCIDNYGNYYSFIETNVMQYELMLDNYTIIAKEDSTYYKELDKFDKSRYNLDIFKNMINTKDYSAIYKVLDNTFKNNNFKNEIELQKFIEKNMYYLNNIEVEDYNNTKYDYYVFECKIINALNENESKDMVIIINQTDGHEFTMSFSFPTEK